VLFGFLSISLSSFPLSHAATTISEELSLSEVLQCRSLDRYHATRKIYSYPNSSRGYANILVANTAGSNISLVTLSLSIVILDTGGTIEHGNVDMTELATLWSSTLALNITGWSGRSTRCIGRGTLIGYVVFII